MSVNKLKHSLIFKITCFMLIFSMFPWEFLSPKEVNALGVNGHDSYFIETLFNSNGGYEVQVLPDKNTFGDSKEENEMQNAHGTGEYLSWTDYSASINGTAVANYADSKFGSGSSSKDIKNNEGLIFSFPSHARKLGESYSQDYSRAITVADTLSSSLNNLLLNVRSNYKYNDGVDSEQKIIDSIYILDNLVRPTDFGNEWATAEVKINGQTYMTIYYATDKGYTGKELVDEASGLTRVDADGNLIAYITKGIDGLDSLGGGTQGFVWAMPKGYINPTGNGDAYTTDGTKSPWGVTNNNQTNGADAAWMTIFMLADYARYQAVVHNYTLVDSAYQDESFIESTLYSWVLNIYSGLLNILKLNTIPDLIYNQGTRAGSGYEAGMMNSSWWNTVLKYHLIFQIVAWMMLIAAVAKILIQVNFSTVNPQLTISIMDTLQKIFTVGFALALCIPIIRAMVTLNNLIVGIFQTQGRTTDDEALSALGFAGLIILLGYFGITFVMNAIYIMRAIMIAILTASAPVFITSMAFAGPKQKGLLDNWFKEISANIFMQSIHAFAFAFLFDVMDNSSVLVRLVIYFSLLPIVDSFRQLIFGQAGGFAVSQGKAAAQTVGAFASQTVGGAAKGAANLGVSGAAALMRGAKDGRYNNLDLNTSSPDSGGEGNSTPGESKASQAGSRLSSSVSKIGDAVSKGGKNKATRAMGSALKGATKLADFYKSTGGAMGNAVTQANLGNVPGSMQASQTYGEGIATAEERMGHDIANTAENVSQKRNQQRYENAMKQSKRASEDAATATRDGDENAAQQYRNDAEQYNLVAAQYKSNLNKQSRRRNNAIRVSQGQRGTRVDMQLQASQVHLDDSGNGWASFSDEQALKVFGSRDMMSRYYNEDKHAYNVGKNVSFNKHGDTARVNMEIAGDSYFNSGLNKQSNPSIPNGTGEGAFAKNRDNHSPATGRNSSGGTSQTLEPNVVLDKGQKTIP